MPPTFHSATAGATRARRIAGASPANTSTPNDANPATSANAAATCRNRSQSSRLTAPGCPRQRLRRRLLELDRLDPDRLHRPVASVGLRRPDAIDHVHAVPDLAEHRVLAVE